GVGVGTVANPVLTNLGGTGTLNIATTGAGSAGDVAISDNAAAGLRLGSPTSIAGVTTAAGSVQQATITSTGSGGITFNNNVDFAGATNDNISFIATSGPISLGSGRIGN